MRKRRRAAHDEIQVEDDLQHLEGMPGVRPGVGPKARASRMRRWARPGPGNSFAASWFPLQKVKRSKSTPIRICRARGVFHWYDCIPQSGLQSFDFGLRPSCRESRTALGRHRKSSPDVCLALIIQRQVSLPPALHRPAKQPSALPERRYFCAAASHKPDLLHVRKGNCSRSCTVIHGNQ